MLDFAVGALDSVAAVFLFRTGGGGRGMLGGGGMFRLRGLFTRCTLGLILGAGFGSTTFPVGWDGEMVAATGDPTNTLSESSLTVASLAAGTGGNTATPPGVRGGGGGLRRGLDLWSRPVVRLFRGLGITLDDCWEVRGATIVKDLGISRGSSFSFPFLCFIFWAPFWEGGVRVGAGLGGEGFGAGEGEGAAAGSV